jgi:hypothetical protein
MTHPVAADCFCSGENVALLLFYGMMYAIIMIFLSTNKS